MDDLSGEKLNITTNVREKGNEKMRKKIALVFTVAMMTVAFTACSTNEKTNEEKQTTTEAVKDNNKNENNKGDATVKEAIDIFQTVWASYADDEKFASGGGDSENLSMDGAGKFDISKTEELDATLGFPADSVDLIDDAASLMHMMNANTFTAGAYHVKDAKNTETLATALKDNILARQWMCGFPDKLCIIQVADDYVVSFFGKELQIDTFKTKLTAAFSDAKVLAEQAIE